MFEFKINCFFENLKLFLDAFEIFICVYRNLSKHNLNGEKKMFVIR